MAFVKSIIDTLLVYSTVAATTPFLYYTLIDTGPHTGLLSWVLRTVALASRLSDRENVQSRLPSSLKTCVNCGL